MTSITEATLDEIRAGFLRDGDELIGFRRLTEPHKPGHVIITGWEFIGRKSIVGVDRDGSVNRQQIVQPVDKFMDELTSDAYTGLTNADRSIDHPLVGTERVYRADQPPYIPSGDGSGPVTILGNGMTVYITAAFYDWNGVPGLDMLAVNVNQTRCRTHVTPADLGWTQPLRAHTRESEANPDLEWTYEGPDPEVGIFGEAMYHDPCQPDNGDPIEAEEQQADVHTRDEHTVAITRIWKCPTCGKTYESVSFEPREHMEADMPGGDE